MNAIKGIGLGIAVIAAAVAGCATDKGAANSGFLQDYSRLHTAKDTTGKTVRAWVSPKLTPQNYHALLVEPIVFHPEPAPSERVSGDDLRQMLAYSNETLKRSLSQRFEVVDRPGPGVVRLRIAFSGVGAEGEGLKPYQYIPIALVATMATRAATGGAPQRAFIVVEVEGTDSVSGELLGQRVRVGTGERLKGLGSEGPLTLELVKPLLDELAAQSFPELAKYVRPK
jgi:hypothetical protein